MRIEERRNRRKGMERGKKNDESERNTVGKKYNEEG